MSVDLNRFHQVFFNEAKDHLEKMEGQRLALDLNARDFREFNAVFSAAHAIKGRSVAVFVDAVLGPHRVLIKNRATYYRKLREV